MGMTVKEHIEAGHYPADEKGRALVPVGCDQVATICATDAPGVKPILGFIRGNGLGIHGDVAWCMWDERGSNTPSQPRACWVDLQPPAPRNADNRIAEHTPGPWIAAAGPSSIVGWPIVGNQGRAICAITWPRHMARTAVSEEFYQECAANARLIAAAPALYEALRAMVNRWEPEADGYADRRMWEAACEAIAQVKGQS